MKRRLTILLAAAVTLGGGYHPAAAADADKIKAAPATSPTENDKRATTKIVIQDGNSSQRMPVLKVAPGFDVERVTVVSREAQGSWVSLCSDARGVLYASDQYGPLFRVELPAAHDGAVKVRDVKLPIGGAHGLTWVGNDLYAVVGQREVCPPGLYRLRDTDGDGELDEVKLLRALAGDGEHAPHAVVAAPDGRSLYIIAGNATQLPELARSRVPQHWRDDSLLPPLPALMGSELKGLPHGGWICHTDLDGHEWELTAMGLRNAYSLACDATGELFTFDSDTEMEIGLPWYRPTRLLHVVSGADFGWRKGALKAPERAPDTVPALLPMGLGSPTAVLFVTGAAFPQRYRDALFVADWSFGRLQAVHLRPSGAGFAAETEEIVTGTPLPITAACVNPRDGAFYFVTGGRKTQSALYRLTWIGDRIGAAPKDSSPVVIRDAVRRRRALEKFHGREDPRAIESAWPHLGSDDALLRHAARIAVESQPVSGWQDQALAEKQPRSALTALLALARVGDAALQPKLLAALLAMDWHELGALRYEWLRVVALTLTRGGGAKPEIRTRWAEQLGQHFPTNDRTLDVALGELLVFLDAPGIAAKTMVQLHTAATHEEQLDYARILRSLTTNWTPELRGEFFDWLGQASAWRGGGSFKLFVNRLRSDALASAPEPERAGLAKRLAAATPSPAKASAFALPTGRGFVKEWTLTALTALAENAKTPGRIEDGRRWFAAIGCAACHTFAREGGALGPDLTAVAGRFSTHDLLESIVDPNKEISDQYGTIVLTKSDGTQLNGRIGNHSEGVVQVVENLFEPSVVTKVKESDVRSIEPSKISLMPAGLLNLLQADEILDLIAYLKSGLNQP